jgi:hypothetical protein
MHRVLDVGELEPAVQARLGDPEVLRNVPTGAWPLRATATTSRRNSSGNGFGTIDFPSSEDLILAGQGSTKAGAVPRISSRGRIRWGARKRSAAYDESSRLRGSIWTNRCCSRATRSPTAVISAQPTASIQVRSPDTFDSFEILVGPQRINPMTVYLVAPEFRPDRCCTTPMDVTESSCGCTGFPRSVASEPD